MLYPGTNNLVVVSGTAALDRAHPSPRAPQQLRDCYLGQQRLDVGGRRGLLNLRRSHGEHDARHISLTTASTLNRALWALSGSAGGRTRVAAFWRKTCLSAHCVVFASPEIVSGTLSVSYSRVSTERLTLKAFMVLAAR